MNRREAGDTAERGGHALLWATLGAIAATYAHRRYYKSRSTGTGTQAYGSQGLDQGQSLSQPQSQGLGQGRSAGLTAVVSEPILTDGPIPSQDLQDLSAASQQEPIAEDPYPPGNPSPLPTGPSPGG